MRYVRPYPNELEVLRGVLPRINTPVQIINGNHFVWEDAADEYAAIVSAWWAEGFNACMNKSTPTAAGF